MGSLTSKPVILGVVIVIVIAVAVVASYLLMFKNPGQSKATTTTSKVVTTTSLMVSATIRAGGSTWIQPQMEVWIRNFTSPLPLVKSPPLLVLW